MQAFVDTHGLGSMVTLVDDDGALWRRYGVLYQPAWVFIGTDGEIDTVGGALSGPRLHERLDALLSGGASG